MLDAGFKPQERTGTRGTPFKVFPLLLRLQPCCWSCDPCHYSDPFLHFGLLPVAIRACRYPRILSRNTLHCNSPFEYDDSGRHGEELWHFLQRKINLSSVAPVLWALLQYRNVFEGRAEWERWLKVMGTVMAGYSVGGSAFGVAGSMWIRDELVFEAEQETPVK